MNGSPAAPKDVPALEHLFRPADLIAAWQQRADLLDQFGDPNSARLWRTAAVELERTLAAFGAETLTPDEAARLSGYSPDYIRKQIAAGDLPNAGRKNAPRVCRGGHDNTWLTASRSSIASRRRGPAARAGRRGADR